jgi:hypothetical protein
MTDITPPPTGGREPVEAPPIRATFTINTGQGIQVPESLLPKGEDGKPLLTPSDPYANRHLERYRRVGVDEASLQQYREGKPISRQEHDLTQYKIDALKRDPVFSRNYLDGRAEETRIFSQLHKHLSLPIKKDDANA